MSPHGFGHATRGVAVIQAFLAADPQGKVTVFTSVPRFLFDELPSHRVDQVTLACDIGLKQLSPLVVDMPGTIEALRRFWPPRPSDLQSIVHQLHSRQCHMVVCDIAPLGILAGKKAGLPVCLIENFTWDWIYAGMARMSPALACFASDLADVFATVDLHIQTEPICRPVAGARKIDLIVRPLRQTRQSLRRSIGVGASDRLVLITMGGVAASWDFFSALKSVGEIGFLLPGFCERDTNLIGLGEIHQFYHPDWVAAADLVVGKLGYSTVAELVQAGSPIAYVDRPDFPESSILADFIQHQVPAFRLNGFEDNKWIDHLTEWVGAPRSPRRQLNGANQAARLLLDGFKNI